MEMATQTMDLSIHEPRDDKTCPQVGAVLVKPNGDIEKAYRGELREGDHAEFTLLERKNRANKLDGSLLFVTLEPCAPGARNHPKLSCAERIVNARIKKVWIGIEDPDPTVDRKGINYLLENGIQVEMFDLDLQEKIRKSNKHFIKEAEERAKKIKSKPSKKVLSNKELAVKNSNMENFSPSEIDHFIYKAKLDVSPQSDEFIEIFSQMGFIENKKGVNIPTGIGLLLFGKRPQLLYNNALIRATFKTKGRSEDITTIEGSLVNQVHKIFDWYKDKIAKQIDRSKPERKFIYDYPESVLRETIINAIVHRDYDIEGAPIYFEINDNSIIIKSPGHPVPPLNLEQFKQFNAPSLSRNPKIMYAFDQLDLVEQRGLGFQTIKDLPLKYNLPLPITSFQDPYLIFHFPRNKKSARIVSENKQFKELNDEEIIGLDFIKLKGRLKRNDYETFFKYDRKKAERHLSHMVSLGLITRKGNGPSTFYEYNAT